MPLQTEMRANIVAWVDKASFNDGINYARDTWKKIDQALKTKLELDVAWFQIKLSDARKQLKTATWDNRIRLTLEANELQRWLTEAKRNLNNLVNTGDPAVSRLQKKFDWLWWSVKNAFSNLLAFTWIASLAWWVVSLWKSIVSLSSNLEQAKISFTTMLWSAESADKLLRDLSSFASKTPFTIPWIRENAKQLLAMWVSADNLIPTMKILWDVSAWLSVPLERLSLAYWQVLAKWRLQWWELKQFTEAWVPLVKYLSDQLSVSTAEFYNLVEAWQVSSVDVTKALETMTSAWWQFADLMIKQSASIWWLRSNLQDIITQLWEKIGTDILPNMKSFVSSLLSFATQYGDSIWKIFSELIWSIATVISEATSWIVQVVNLWVEAIDWIYKSLSSNTENATQEQLTFTDIVLWFFIAVSNWLKTIVFGIQSFGKILWTFLWVIFNKIDIGVKSAINNAISGINLLIKWINKIPWIDIKEIWLFDTRWVITFKDQFQDVFAEIWDDLDRLSIKSLRAEKSVSSMWSTIWKIDYSKIWWWAKESKAWWWKWWWNKDAIKAINDEADARILALSRTKKSREKNAQEIIDIDRKREEAIKEITWKSADIQIDKAKKVVEEAKKNFETTKSSAEKAFKEVSKAIEKSSDSVEKLEKDLKSVNDSLAEIDQTIWSRVVAIEQELKWYDLSYEQRRKLEEELALAKRSLTEEELAKAREEEAKSETQKLLDKRTALEEKRKQLEEELAFEKTISDNLALAKIDLEKKIADAHEAELKRQENATIKYTTSVIEMYKQIEIAAKKASEAWSAIFGGGTIPWRAVWWPVSAWSPYIVGEKWPEMFVPHNSGTIIPNNVLNNNINVNANVANGIDMDVLANTLAHKIALTRKWVF